MSSPTKSSIARAVLITAIVASGPACEASVDDAAWLDVPIVVDGRALDPVVTDLGYSVEVTSYRSYFGALEATRGGQEHREGAWELSSWRDVSLISTAWAHPGHNAGGDAIAFLPGSRVVDWVSDAGMRLGIARMPTGRYDGANYELGPVVAGMARADGGTIADGDPLIGSSAQLTAIVTRDGEQWLFSAKVRHEDGTRVIGVPFMATVESGDLPQIEVQPWLTDRDGADTLFDGIDFGALEPDVDGSLTVSGSDPDAVRIRNAMQRHEFFGVVASP